MTYLNQTHLNDEQLFSLLTPSLRVEGAILTTSYEGVILSEVEGPAFSSAATHLAACPRCQSELKALHASLTNLRLATTAFAAAGTPTHAPRIAAHRRTSSLFRPAWAMSFATAAALCVATLAYIHPIHQPHPKSQDTPIESASTQEADDALLNDIQRDLSTNVAPSLAPLSVSSR